MRANGYYDDVEKRASYSYLAILQELCFCNNWHHLPPARVQNVEQTVAQE